MREQVIGAAIVVAGVTWSMVPNGTATRARTWQRSFRIELVPIVYSNGVISTGSNVRKGCNMVIPIDRFEHTRPYFVGNGRFDLQRINVPGLSDANRFDSASTRQAARQPTGSTSLS